MIRHTERKDALAWERQAAFPASPSGANAAVALTAPGLRIDNRAELLERLALSPHISDEALLLAAWRQWREGMADKLRGSFAVAIFDFARQELYLARDIFGLSPLYYSLDQQRLVAGASSRRVRAIMQGGQAHDRPFLADFVCGQFTDSRSTFHSGLHRLPPAHYMLVTAATAEIQRYWSPGDVPRRESCPDAVEQFRDLFDRSVARSLEAGRPSLPLSGGIDSSAIAGSLAASGLQLASLPTLTMTYRESANWTDAPYLDDLARYFAVQTQEIPCDRHDPLSGMEHWLTVLDGPYVSYGHSVSSQLLPLSAELGCDTLLSGHGGDEVISYGLGRLNELARSGRWLELWRELEGAAGLFGQSRTRLFRKYLTHKPFFRRVERKLASLQPAENAALKPALSKELAEEAGPDRYAGRPAVERSEHDERMLHEEALENPIQPLALETIGACSRASGIETQMPFYDRELVEFSLSLPSEWKLRDGLTRRIMRLAMQGRLPESILRRRSKFDFSEAFRAGLLESRAKILDLTAPGPDNLGAFIDGTRLNGLRDRLSRNETKIEMDDAYFLWRVTILAMWLDIAKHPLESPPMQILQGPPPQ